MKEEQFFSLVKKTLGHDFEKLGYRFYEDCFFQNRDDGFRNVVSFDFDGNNSFRIFVGIDYPYDQVVDSNIPPDGARLNRYFTGGSLSSTARDIFFKDDTQLMQQLDRFSVFFTNEIKDGFFGVVKTPEDYADNLPEIECIVKFEIYKNEKVFEKAIEQAKVILNSYKNMLDIPKIKNFIDCNVKVFLVEQQEKKKGTD